LETVIKKDSAAGVFSVGTSRFKVERGSVLHSGIYSRELSSTFTAAGAAAVFAYFSILIYGGGDGRAVAGFWILAEAVLVFVLGFAASMKLLFIEPWMETTVERGKSLITVSKKGRWGMNTILRRDLKDLTNARITGTRLKAENPDGAAFVEKIALQHGTVMPGFGAEKVIYGVELVFGDAGEMGNAENIGNAGVAGMVIHVTEDASEANAVADGILGVIISPR
jgi:hypothetical protein